MAHGLQHAKETMQEELHAAKQEMRSSWEADLQQALLTLPLKGAACLPATSLLSTSTHMLTELLFFHAEAASYVADLPWLDRYPLCRLMSHICAARQDASRLPASCAI